MHENARRPKKREVKADAKETEDEPGSDANEDEIQRMNAANTERIKLQKQILDRLVNIKYGRCLDVAGGRGLLTDELLRKRYG